jgi:hypothetical protein
MAHRITVSLDDDVWRLVQDKGNKSRYVAELILADYSSRRKEDIYRHVSSRLAEDNNLLDLIASRVHLEVTSDEFFLAEVLRRLGSRNVDF